MATASQLAQYCLDHGFVHPTQGKSMLNYIKVITLADVGIFAAGWCLVDGVGTSLSPGLKLPTLRL